jgi:Flp pilus assembly protein TadB
MKFWKKELKNIETQEEKLRKIFIKEVKKKKVDIKAKGFLRDSLKKAGYDIEYKKLKRKVFDYSIYMTVFLSIVAIVYSIIALTVSRMIALLLMVWILGFPLIWLMSWLILYYYLDMRKYKRTKELEEVWPEYLQLVVANINAGMLIDVALWSAVKPRFKVLAKEIEEVAKQTLTGKDLSDALREFADKYDSAMVQRTVSLLIEGMDSGGKIAVLLNKIALDIQDTKIMKKEMSASVMTYAIFITFATVVAAPFLFGLSTQLLIVIQKIIGTLSQTSSAGASFITFQSESVKISDFKTFAYVMLGITSFMSACLIGTIRKGSVKDGLKFIPIFVISTLLIYFVSSMLLASLLGGMI